MRDDWRERWRGWLDRDSFAHPNSPAGGSGTGFSRPPGSIGYSWSPLPDPNSPAGRLIHWQTEIWELERRERDEIARHVEELESSLAKESDKLRESIPNDYLRTLYDRQVGRTKGTYGFAKSLIGTGVDAALLLQKLTSPVGWLDLDLHRKLQQGYSFGLAVGKSYVVWEFGTLQEKKRLLEHVGALAGRVYEEAKKSIQQQWAEAKRTGKQEELIEKWKTRILLEVGTLFVGAGELKAAGSAAEGFEITSDASRTAGVGDDILRGSSNTAEAMRNASQVDRSLQSAAAAPKPLLLPPGRTTNTIQKARLTRGPKRWRAGEQSHEEMWGSTGQQHFQVPTTIVSGEEIKGTGGRFVDTPVPTTSGGIVAREVKMYQRWRTVNGQPVEQFVPLSDGIRQQVLKDVWLRDNVPGFDPRWEFLDAQPSPELSQYLAEKGIIYVVHE